MDGPETAEQGTARRFNLHTVRKRSKQSLLSLPGEAAAVPEADSSSSDPLASTSSEQAGTMPPRGRSPGLPTSASGWALSQRGGGSTAAWLGVAGQHALNWGAVLALIVILAATDNAAPRESYIPKALLPETSYPLLPNSVPSWSVPLYSVLAPALVFALNLALGRRPVAECHHLLLGLMAAVMATAVLTNALKLPVGRLRPDFNARCWPDGKVAWAREDELGGYAACSGAPASVAEGRKSFPSGHSSWSAAGLVYLSLFLTDRLAAFAPAGAGQPWRLLAAWLPALGALAVGVSRVIDYWHHPTDVLAGLALGSLAAAAAYRQQRLALAELQPETYAPRGPAPASARAVGELELEPELFEGAGDGAPLLGPSHSASVQAHPGLLPPV